MNCLENYLRSAHVKSDKPAVIFFKGLHSLQKATSFNELYEKSLTAQKYLLDNGYKKGDALLLFESPTADLYAFILASLGLGVRLLIIEPWMKGEAINNILLKIQPRGIMTGTLGKLVLSKSKEAKKIPHQFQSKVLNQGREKLSEIIVEDMDPNDHAILTFTSGTSGVPKGVHRKHQYLMDQAQVLKKYLHYDQYPKLDLTVFTNVVLLNLTLGKGSLVLPTSWKPSILRQLDSLPEDFQVDTTACGPAFLHKLLNNTKTLELKAFHIGGALADIRLYEKVIERWPNASMHHVYGSTEAEPVALSDLSESIKKSKEHGYFQTLFLGNAVDEISLMTMEDSLYVSGKHVSPMYENDEKANKENKYLDENGTLWHNMGDRINQTEEGLFYAGRAFQSPAEFKLEQSVYSFNQSSASFIKTLNGKTILFGEKLDKKKIKENFPAIDYIIERKIIRDVRHKARIDRVQSYEKGSSMKNILIFIKERVPVIPNLILAFGLYFSAKEVIDVNFYPYDFYLIFAVLVAFITELRFMDEIKDFEKDKVAHPDRPLPRGLVTLKQVSSLMYIGFAILLGLMIPSYMIYGKVATVLLGIVNLWLFLMYKEFFLGDKLAKSPLIYAITHQLIIVPIILFATTILEGNFIILPSVIGFILVILSAFFTYEVGRKMDPQADPILGTYLVHYGKVKTHLLITVLASLSVIGGVLLNAFWYTFIPFILIILTQVRAYKDEKIFKQLEGIISLVLIYNLWFLVIKGLL